MKITKQFIIGNIGNSSFLISHKEAFVTLGLSAFIGMSLYSNIKGNFPETSEKFLENHNYTSVQIGDNSNNCRNKGFLTGSPMNREFTAINPKGEQVEGFLCAGALFRDDQIVTTVITSKNKPR